MKPKVSACLSTLAALLLFGCGDDVTGPVEIDSEWSGQIDQGKSIEIKGVIGSITATATSGNEVRVSVVKTGQQSDPASVTIEVVEHSDGVTICAVYPDVPGQAPNECAPGGQGHMSVDNNDVDVAFTVLVPAGVDFIGTTVAGDVIATDLQSDVFATIVSGNATITTTGIALATTVTGSITADIRSTDWGQDLAFLTVTGTIDVTIPSDANADVVATVVTGMITTDFPLTRVSEGRVEGTIGDGTWALALTTVTGNIALHEGS
jgi:hypothetical protein